MNEPVTGLHVFPPEPESFIAWRQSRSCDWCGWLYGMTGGHYFIIYIQHYSTVWTLSSSSFPRKSFIRNDDSLLSVLTCETNRRLLHHNIFFFCIDFPFISANFITTVFTLLFIVLWNSRHTLILVTKIRAVIHFEDIFFNQSDYWPVQTSLILHNSVTENLREGASWGSQIRQSVEEKPLSTQHSGVHCYPRW